MDDVRTNLASYHARISAAPEAPVAGGRRADSAAGPVAASAAASHRSAGTDEAGSGGDD
jgi:hypothetical protein